MFFKIGACLKFHNFHNLNIHNKNLCWGLFRIKLQGFSSAALLKRDSKEHRCFPVNVAKFLRTAFLWNTFGG